MTGDKAIEPALLEEIARTYEADLAGAEARLRQLLECHPEDAQGWLLLTRLCLRRSGFAEMEAAAGRALALLPRSAPAVEAQALSDFYQGRLEAAAQGFERLTGLRRDGLEAARLATCLHRLGRLGEAETVLRGALAAPLSEGRRRPLLLGFLLLRLLRDLGRREEGERVAARLQARLRKRPVAMASRLLGFTNRMDFHEWDRFRSKEGLARALRSLAAGPERARAPRHPASFVMPEHRQELEAAASEGRSGPLWIVKPTSLYGGQGMRVVERLEDLPREAGSLIQDYVADPYLVEGRKAHLRLYLLVTAPAPLRAWFWGDGLARFAPEPYRQAPGWLERPGIHITNSALHQDHPGLSFSDDPAVENQGSVWSLRAYLARIGDEKGAAAEATVREGLAELARGFLATVEADGLFARQAALPAPRACPPKLVGLDVLLDADLQPWLLEAQRMPGQTGPGPVVPVNGRLFRTIAEMIAAPLGEARDLETAEAAAEADAAGLFQRLS